MTETYLTRPTLRTALATSGLMPRIQAVTRWWGGTRIARTLTRYGTRNGGLLSSGMALTTLLSLTAALTVGWTVFMAVLGGNDELRRAVTDSLNAAMPGLLRTESDPSGLVDPDSLTRSGAWSVTGVVALVVAAWSAISVVGAMAASVRAMFGLVSLPENGLLTLGRHAIGAVALAAGLVISAGLGVGANLAGTWAMESLGIDPGIGRTLLLVVSSLIPLMVDAAVLLLLIRVVAGARVPRRDLAWGLAMFAVASAVLRQLGTSAVGAVSGPLLATATTLITLVLWINLLVRVMLTICAWMANPPAAAPVTDAASVHFDERPNYVTMSVPSTLTWPRHPVTGEVQPEPASDAGAGDAAAPGPGAGDATRSEESEGACAQTS